MITVFDATQQEDCISAAKDMMSGRRFAYTELHVPTGLSGKYRTWGLHFLHDHDELSWNTLIDMFTNPGRYNKAPYATPSPVDGIDFQGSFIHVYHSLHEKSTVYTSDEDQMEW